MTGAGEPHAAPAGLHVVLRPAGRRCTVVGAGAVGTRRVLALLAAGAAVEVVDPSPTAAVRELAAAGELRWVERGARAHLDVDGAWLVVVATDDPDTNEAVAEAASAAGALVSRADDAEGSDLWFPATVRHGPLTVALGSTPPAPAVTGWAADRVAEGLEALLGASPEELDALVGVVTAARAEWRPTMGTTTDGAGEAAGTHAGPPDWRTAIDRTMLDMVRHGRLADAKEHLLACRSSS